MNDDRLKKIVWFAGFYGRNSALIFKVIQKKSWQNIFNERFAVACPLCGNARNSKAHRKANCAEKNKAKGF